MAVTDKIYAVQLLDSEIDRRMQAAKQLDDGSALAAQVKAAKARLEEAQQAVKNLRAELEDSELELKGTESKLKQVNDKLYGGRVTNPKELEDLASQEEVLKRKRNSLDEKVLELISSLEASEAEVERLQAALAKITEEYKQVRRRFEQTVGRLKQEVASLLKRREAARAEVEPALLSYYDMLRKRYGGVVVVKVSEPICGGCNMKFSDQVWQDLRAGEQVVKCGNCARILHFERT